MSVTLDVSITRANIDDLLDHRMIEMKVITTQWWSIRRNGKTWRGRQKANASRIKIPVKAGLRTYAQITEKDFRRDGTLDPSRYRLKTDGV